jgi:hypothetical protein
MYWLMSIDALLRIAFALAFLFIVVPALAWPWRKGTFLETFFWNLGVGVTLLTVCGQVLTLFNLFSLMTLLVVAALVIVLGRARHHHESPWTLVRRTADTTFLALLNILDRRVNLPRRLRRGWRRTRSALRAKLQPRAVRLQIAGWLGLTAVAAAFRLYRPFVTANLGFSDSYVHLYFVQLLEEGRQVDPDFGPYPRGMHFLLAAIHHLTNVDVILLMNFFGSVIGVLMCLAVADTARRLSGNTVAGLIAGFLFATSVGARSQAFILGAHDVLLDTFHRQTTTLSQELSLVLLFPAATFLLRYLTTQERWYLIGSAGCTAAIAAIHSGVLLPLVLMDAVAVLVVVIRGRLRFPALRRAVAAGVLAVVIGSAWMIAFFAYPYFSGRGEERGGYSSRVIATVYTPFIETFLSRDRSEAVRAQRALLTPFTPFLAVSLLLGIGLVMSSFLRRDERHIDRLWIAVVLFVFLFIHLAPLWGIPPLLETSRNAQWLMMAVAMVIGIAASELLVVVRPRPRLRLAAGALIVVLLVVWTLRVPRPTDSAVHDRIINYSGYSLSTLAVLKIRRSLEPYTWTVISYGQEFPMVLRRGFHLPAAQFLASYDPMSDILLIPTPHVFIIVEKTPHQFEIANWARRFSREDIERRLQTWVYLYQTSHKNLTVFLEDENVRVYHIERTRAEIEKIARRPRV